MRRQWIVEATIIALVCWVTTAAITQTEAATDDLSSVDSLVMMIDPHTYTVGNLRIDAKRREIVLPGWVNLDSGQVEYFATSPGGKTHESVLVLDAVPLHLQTALLLLGFESGRTTMHFQGDSTEPLGDSVAICVKWQDPSGHDVIYQAHQLVYNAQRQSSMQATAWLFTGSMVIDGRFMADLDGSFIATYADPVAVLNNPLAGRLDDTVYEANKKTLPKPGTPVAVTISKWSQPTLSKE
ncbi:MAG: YdjY domain-containing protein [candidate division Zixibacteria bacterium]|nr:YdjY domain-containing protein [candidate division Zixibacteria bacterium]MDH3937738.1 YdjY domain-containing protein [candidate division Zixibacteria bacterium]MDH4033078.1 YdjY domain-containing protein [candidate division Zixibacteria bacterium]